jgi:ribosomal protein L14E/L6E/L27E
MEIEKSHIVISLAGRDKGDLFFVFDRDARSVVLADGKSRKLEKPKRKNIMHVRFVSESSAEIADAIKNGGKVSDKDLRNWLAIFKAGTGNDKGGTYVWQKTM